YGSFYAALPERPDRSSTARVINYGLVRSEVRGRFRLAVLFEISGGAKDSSRALSDFSRDQRGVIERTHAQRYIHSSFDEIDVSIIENDFQFERGMLRKERRESWHDVQSGKRYGGADAQCARQTRVRTSSGELCLVHFLDGSLRTFVEVLAG